MGVDERKSNFLLWWSFREKFSHNSDKLSMVKRGTGKRWRILVTGPTGTKHWRGGDVVLGQSNVLLAARERTLKP